MSDPHNIPQEDMRAAEYVLRLLDPADEAAFEARLLNEPDLKAQVLYWEAELARLVDTTVEETPPANLKRKLLLEIEGTPSADAGGRKWNFAWLGFPAILAVAVVAFFAVLPIFRAPEFDPTLHATLVSADGALHIEAGYSPNGNLFKVIHEDGSPSIGRSYELWVIGAKAQSPVSLGLVPLDGEIVFEISEATAALIDGGTLAVSDEPAGGSPTGAPTGAVLALDKFFEI